MSSHHTKWVLELVDRVSAPFKSIKRWADNGYISVAKLDRRLDVLKDKSSALTGRLKKLALAGGAFALMSMGSLEFESGMARANTMMQVGQTEMTQYTRQIKDLSVFAGQAKTNLADGLYGTISAGVPKGNAIQFLKDSTKAAVGGTAELGLVVESTSAFIKNYGESWENASKIQDKFQKTIQLGQINGLGELASALPRVTNMAAQLGVTQSEMLGVFATGSGVLGASAEVSTMLGATLTAMLKPSAEANKMANQLGISFNSEVIKKAGGLKNYVDVLIPRIKAFSKQSGVSQEEIIGKLFGSAEAIKLVMAMGGNLNQSWAVNTQQIANSTGSVQTAFDIMMTTTKAKVEQITQVFGNNIDAIVTHLAPLTNFLLQGVLVVAKWSAQFMDAHPILTRVVVITGALVFGLVTLATVAAFVSVKMRMASVMLQLTAVRGSFLSRSLARAALASIRLGKNIALTGLNALKAGGRFLIAGLQGIGGFVLALVSATAAQWGLNIAMNANPLGLIVLGLAAVIGVVVLVVKYWDQLKLAIINFGKFFLKASPFYWLIQLADVVFPGVKEKIKDVFNSVIKWFKNMWDSIKGVWNKITAFFGFGDSKAEVIVSKNPDDVDTPQGNPLGAITGGNSKIDAKGLLTGGGGTALGGVDGGSGGGGKTVTQNFDFKNYITVPAGTTQQQIDAIVSATMGKLNDALRDSQIQFG